MLTALRSSLLDVQRMVWYRRRESRFVDCCALQLSCKGSQHVDRTVIRASCGTQTCCNVLGLAYCWTMVPVSGNLHPQSLMRLLRAVEFRHSPVDRLSPAILEGQGTNSVSPIVMR